MVSWHDHRVMIQAEGLTRRYGTTTAVDGVSFDVRAGEVFGLLGPDGAGKTTLFRMLATVLEPSAGSARIGGADVRRSPETVKERIGYMPQALSLYTDMTVLENLRFVAEVYRVPRAHLGPRLQRLLGFSRLGPFIHRRTEHLSGGMKQKLALAATLIHEPEVLLLDEPTTGVDPVSRREFWQILYDLNTQGKTVVVATPYMDEAERCTRVALMHRGRILTVDAPEQMKAHMDGIVLEVVAAPRRQALRVAREIAEVKAASVFGHALHLVLPAREAEPRVIETLRTAGIAVEDARVIEPSLEDIFVSLLSRTA